MNTLSKLRYPVARASLGAIFFIMGLTKISSFAGVAGWMASSGVPFAKLLLVLTIAIEVGGGLLLIIGKQTRWAALALAAFIVPVTLIFHAFWNADAASFQDQLTHFLKNLAILGGMLLLAAPAAANSRS
ncbi:DoxX family protein [Lysobacter sp. CCNWLW3]|uniref:DoxX family protein n=1 Tax=unclassified Lysobacter TaxID=2635362 RepID=UPI002FD06124